jgi:AsmA protein
LGGTYKLATMLRADKSPLAELNGAVRWNLANSAIRGVDLVRSLREFRPAITAGKQSARTPVDAETTELGAASSRFLLAGGKVQADSIQSRNSWLALNGAGSADLLSDELDFTLQASLLPGMNAMAAKDLADLRSKPITLRLKGPLMRPDVRYEPSLAVGTSAKPAVVTKK